MRSRALPIAFAVLLSILIVVGVIYSRKNQESAADNASVAAQTAAAAPAPSANPSLAAVGAAAAATTIPAAGGSPAVAPSPSAVDLTTDADGLSKATVVIKTEKGLIKFKFYPKDAPNTVHRMIQLIQSGFYNGLTFHRVVPGFVIQGGDPQGNGTGGSGVKLKAEFNDRHHVEGTVAMARASDPDSADSQFYICLSAQPQLDHQYTVFGQVIDGMDVVRAIRVGDKMLSVTIQ